MEISSGVTAKRSAADLVGYHWLFWKRMSIDPPGHGRIGGHYFHKLCPSVRPGTLQKPNALQSQCEGPENKRRPTTNTMRKNNENLLAMAGWIILNSLDLF